MPSDGTAKKVRQITVKMQPELYGRFEKACDIQQHRDGQLARILIEWALPFYERARSVEDLNAASEDIVRRQVEIEREVYQRGKTAARDRKQREG